MKQVSFEGIGQMTATFTASEQVKEGQVVKVDKAGNVVPCDNGKRPAGVVVSVRGGCAAVQVRGFVNVKAAGVKPGWVKLSADGNGGMKVDDSMGVEYLAVDADAVLGTATILL